MTLRSSLLFTCLWKCSALAAAAAYYSITDADGIGRIFEGIGAISGGGATSRLLIDYVEPQRSQIYDYLFLPNFGAALQILKVEIGGSCDSTNGAEAPHRYTAEEAPSFTRGYEWDLIVEARKRNPAIRIYGLPWCWPAFVGGASGEPFTIDGGAVAAAYVTEWAVAARDVYNVSLWALGLWNERPSTPDYIINLRASLDRAGLTSTQIVASDEGGWPGASQVLANASVAAAVAMLGSHYPGASSSAQALETGKPLLASEDNSRSALPGANGGACWGRALVENAVHGNLSGSISWSLINSWYNGIEFYGDGLMSAVEPWSGNYYIGAPIFSSAHVTHFTDPGYVYLQRDTGTQYLVGGGTMSSLTSIDRRDLTIIIEKLMRNASVCSWSSSPANTTTAEIATLALGGSFASLTSLFAFRSVFDASGAADPDSMLNFMGELPVVSGSVTLSIAVNELWTLSTRNSSKGVAPAPPASAPFPLVWNDSFDSVPLSQEPRYLSDMNGNFEVVDASPYGRPGRVLRSMTPARPIVWLRQDTTPHAIIGSSAWADVNVSSDVWVPSAGVTVALGAHCFGLNVDNTVCLWLRMTAGAAASGGAWAVFSGAAAMSNSSVAPKASGAVDFAPAAWHALEIHVAGGTATLWADGALLANVSLGGVGAPATGFAALGTAAYGHFSVFDNLALSAVLPPPPPPPPSCAAHGPTTPCTPGAAGTLLTTADCSVASTWAWGAGGTLSPVGAPTLCAAINATRKNPQTGAPSVELQVCAAGAATQTWAAPSGNVVGRITDSAGACLEVTKNELGVGVLMEVWACNGGANQAFCATAGGLLLSSLDGECVSACG